MNQLGPLPATRLLPAGRRQAIRRQLEQAVSRPRQQRAPRLAIVAGAAVVVMAGTGAGAAVYLQAQPVTNKTEARCYAAASLAGGSHFPGTTIAAAGAPGSRGQVDNALSVCAALWRQGILTPGHGPGSASGGMGRHRVPPLVACTMPDGTAAVFPVEPAPAPGSACLASRASRSIGVGRRPPTPPHNYFIGGGPPPPPPTPP
jgi:hypothetical protein